MQCLRTLDERKKGSKREKRAAKKTNVGTRPSTW